MYCINDKQIDFILNDIRARGVEMEDLQYNLLDHVCCIIEHELEENGDFENFYKKTIPRFYKQALWEIEEETITLLTFKHYYTMKKIMLVSGTISAAFLTVGIILKFMHLPGAGIMLVLGIGLASLLFLPLLFTLKIREKQKSKDKLVLGIGMIASIAMSLGILFKVMHWPGANMMGLGAVLIMAFVFLPIYFFSGIRNPETKVNTIVSSLVIILGCGLFFTLINSRPSASIEKTNILANQNMQNTYEWMIKQSEINFKNLNTDTNSTKALQAEIHNQANKLCTSIENLKLRLVNFTTGLNYSKVNYNEIPDGNNFDASTHFLFNNDGIAQQDLINLKNEIEAFNLLVKDKAKIDASQLINLGERENANGEKVTWETAHFYYTPISIILRNLTQLQVNILHLEANSYSIK